MIVFYSDTIDSKSGLLTKEEARHCIKALRKKEGATITVFDGIGGQHNCIVTAIGRNEVSFDIVESDTRLIENHLPIIGIGLLKNASRFEWFLEKATEIGARSIIPLVTSRTEHKKFKHERAQMIITSAMKQSLRVHLPQLMQPMNLKDATIATDIDQRYICHYNPINPHLYDSVTVGKPSFLLIGPEGDFTNEEISLTEQYGFQQVNISDTRLRTETAGITAAQIISLKNRK